MDIEKALSRMDSTSRDIVKADIAMFKRSGDKKYLDEAVAIIKNFSDDDSETIKRLILRR